MASPDRIWISEEQQTVPELLRARLESDPDSEYLDVCGVKSSAADVATTGPLTIPIMKKTGVSAVRAGAIEATASVERAMAFGAQQMLAQHRGLWQLLEARATARHAM